MIQKVNISHRRDCGLPQAETRKPRPAQRPRKIRHTVTVKAVIAILLTLSFTALLSACGIVREMFPGGTSSTDGRNSDAGSVGISSVPAPDDTFVPSKDLIGFTIMESTETDASYNVFIPDNLEIFASAVDDGYDLLVVTIPTGPWNMRILSREGADSLEDVTSGQRTLDIRPYTVAGNNAKIVIADPNSNTDQYDILVGIYFEIPGGPDELGAITVSDVKDLDDVERMLADEVILTILDSVCAPE